MSDFNSSLPVRTESNGDIAVKVVDKTLTSQGLSVNADGSVNITDNAGSLTVDGTVTVTATALDTRHLTFANDKVDVTGSSVTVTATALDIRHLTPATDAVKVGDGTNLLAVNSDGSINVSLSTNLAGNEINNYATNASLAGGASSNHDYTVSAGKTLYLKQIETSGSGKIKAEIQAETGVGTGVFTSKFVQFNSTANPNISFRLESPLAVAAGVKVRVIRTNKDNQSQDVYSTISGQEV